MTDDVNVSLRGAAEQLYGAALNLMGRVGSGEEVPPKEVRELAAAIRELITLRDMLAPPEVNGGIRVVFDGGEEAWSR